MDFEILNAINIKYNSYKKNNIIKKVVNNCLLKIYEDNKINSINKLMEFINY